MTLRIRFRIEDGSGLGQRVVLSLDGELDLWSVAALRDRLARIAAEERLWLDLSGLTFIDSSGLGAISAAKRDRGECLRLVGTRPPILHVFESAGMSRLVNEV